MQNEVFINNPFQLTKLLIKIYPSPSPTLSLGSLHHAYQPLPIKSVALSHSCTMTSLALPALISIYATFTCSLFASSLERLLYCSIDEPIILSLSLSHLIRLCHVRLLAGIGWLEGGTNGSTRVTTLSRQRRRTGVNRFDLSWPW